MYLALIKVVMIVKHLRQYALSPVYKSTGNSGGKNLYVYSPDAFEKKPIRLEIGPAAVVILSDGEEEEKMTMYDRFANKKST